MKTEKFVFLVIILSFYSCRDKPFFAEEFYDIRFENNSSENIRVYLAQENAAIQYPDTMLPLTKPAMRLVQVGRTEYFYSRTPWEENVMSLPHDTLSIFFFDAGVYEDSAWSLIQNDYLILDRYDLSVEDLEVLDFNITYP